MICHKFRGYFPIVFKQKNLKHLMYLFATYNTESSAKKLVIIQENKPFLGERGEGKLQTVSHREKHWEYSYHFFKFILNECIVYLLKALSTQYRYNRRFFSRDYFSSKPRGAQSNLKLKWHFLSCYQLHFYDLNVFLNRPGTATSFCCAYLKAFSPGKKNCQFMWKFSHH